MCVDVCAFTKITVPLRLKIFNFCYLVVLWLLRNRSGDEKQLCLYIVFVAFGFWGWALECEPIVVSVVKSKYVLSALVMSTFYLTSKFLVLLLLIMHLFEVIGLAYANCVTSLFIICRMEIISIQVGLFCISD